MTTMLRVEEWRIETTLEPEPLPEPPPEEHRPPDWTPPPPPPPPPTMISSMVVSVWEGEKIDGPVIRIQQEMVSELGLDTAEAEEIVPEFEHRFVWEFPYETVKDALEAKGGYIHAGPSEA